LLLLHLLPTMATWNRFPHTTTAGVHCKGCKWDPKRKLCFKNDCAALFTPADLREEQNGWPTAAQPQLIITAGPERSGSTWL
jgi:hypothetical protein